MAGSDEEGERRKREREKRGMAKRKREREKRGERETGNGEEWREVKWKGERCRIVPRAIRTDTMVAMCSKASFPNPCCLI